MHASAELIDLPRPASEPRERMARPSLEVRVSKLPQLRQRVDALSRAESRSLHPSHELRWLCILADGLRHEPYLLEASADGAVVGRLALAFVRSRLFGRFLVSLPYLNSGGVQGSDAAATAALIDRAANLADELDCRYLELRHETRVEHPKLTAELTSKVHMRLRLPESVEQLRAGLKASVRNQVKKGESQGFEVLWGREDRLRDFYDVFSRNMRDLGTPVFSRRLFASILEQFQDDAEICCVRTAGKCIAAGLLIHAAGVTDVPSASSLRAYNATNANMLLYWHLLKRAIERGQCLFDFGRSTIDGPTFRFKKQWGAQPEAAVWQYYVRRGDIGDMRPDNSRHQRLIQAWQRLPLWITRLIGPMIVRGIP